MTWPEIFVARHGETDWNRERRYQGTKDVPLNDMGKRQADANGPLLSELLERDGRSPADFNWYSSPLSRAVETMARMRAAFDQDLPEVTLDKRLVEISFGILEGSLFDELPPELATAPGHRNAEYWEYRPPEGENYDDLTARLQSFASELTGPSIIVAHGGTLRALRHIIAHTPRLEVLNWMPPQGAIAHFEDGRMTLYETELASKFVPH